MEKIIENMQDLTIKEISYDQDMKKHLKLYQLMDAYINSIAVDCEGLVKAIKRNPMADKNMASIASSWLLILDYQSKRQWLYDGRNEYSVGIGNRMLRVNSIFKFVNEHADCSEELIEKLLNNSCIWNRRRLVCQVNEGMVFALMMANNHRTLQQVFSRIVFTYLRESLSVEYTEDKNWWKCPLV